MRAVGSRSSVLWLTLAVVPVAAGLAFAAWPTVGRQGNGTVLIPNGQRLTPAGLHIEVNDRPLGMALSPNKQLLAVVTGSNFGQRGLHLLDVDTHMLKQTIPIANSFVGVGFSAAGDRIYVGGGASNDVKIFARAPDGTFAAAGSLSIPGAAPSGLSLTADGTRLYVALNMTHEVAVIDTATPAIVKRIAVGIYPYTTVVSADGSKVYVSNWGGKVPGPGDFTDGMFPVIVDRRTGIPVTGTVSVIDRTSNSVVKTIDVGLHPCGMALSPAGDRLYVTNANSDTVSVIDTATDTVANTLHVSDAIAARESVLGSSPNAVTVSADGHTLYVANASQNAVAVIDVDGGADNTLRGLIPTGWYPTAVALDASGTQLFVASGYGFGSIAPVPSGQGRSYQDRAGVVSVLEVPNDRDLHQFTKLVRENNASLPADDVIRAAKDEGANGASGPGHPIPMHLGEHSPIKHVFYVIKENRTYDQVCRPQAQQGLHFADPCNGSVVVWSRSDRPARMLVEWSLDEGFHDVQRVRGPHAIETTDFTARQELNGLEPGSEVFVRVFFESLTNDRVRSAPVTGRFVVPPDPHFGDDAPFGRRADLRFVARAYAAARRDCFGRRAVAFRCHVCHARFTLRT